MVSLDWKRWREEEGFTIWYPDLDDQFNKLAVRFKLNLFDNNLKGELTVVISEKKDEKIKHFLTESDKRIISSMINKLSIKEISNLVNQNKKISKKEIYNYCLSLKKWKLDFIY